MNVRSWLICVSSGLALASCQADNPPAAKAAGGAATDADVIVVGGGIAGVAAALEASAHGARVLVVEANSVAGGHAVKAGGFALVDTPLQRSKGYKDSPDIAYRDLMAWGEDNNPWWTRYYADNALTEVHDWLTGMGVKFVVALDTPEDTVPRFHFTRGGAVNAVVPMIREALKRESIRFAWNTEVVELRRQDGAMTGVRTRDLRSGTEKEYSAPAIVLATGGYQNNLPLVRENFWKFLPQPERLLTGAGEFARGSALRLVEPFGVALSRLDHQVTFVNGLPDPRESGDRGLLTQNPDAIWVDATGRRFTNESAPSKVTDRAVLKLVPATHWLVFDSVGMKKLTIRGAAWMSDAKVKAEIIDNPQLVTKADSIAALATAAGLPPDALADTVQRFNRFIDQGLDTDFGRIGPGNAEAPPPAIKAPPFYAIRLYPMTRKSMGGISIDHEARALGGAGQVVRGLFAAGEVTGVAGINGSFGGSGTFLGPSVLTGRVAGRSAVALALGDDALKATKPAGAAEPETAPAPLADIDLPALVRQQRAGYWHFDVSHALVLERGDACATCHTGAWTPGPAMTREQRIIQLDACTKCH
jgi:predicted oxidoreductase